jgi:hypothetical protein
MNRYNAGLVNDTRAGIPAMFPSPDRIPGVGRARVVRKVSKA